MHNGAQDYKKLDFGNIHKGTRYFKNLRAQIARAVCHIQELLLEFHFKLFSRSDALVFLSSFYLTNLNGFISVRFQCGHNLFPRGRHVGRSGPAW